MSGETRTDKRQAASIIVTHVVRRRRDAILSSLEAVLTCRFTGAEGDGELSMDIEYDSETDAAFIWIGVRPEAPMIKGELWPEELKGHIGLLFDAQNRLLGVEVLFASAHLAEDVLKNQS